MTYSWEEGDTDAEGTTLTWEAAVGEIEALQKDSDEGGTEVY